MKENLSGTSTSLSCDLHGNSYFIKILSLVSRTAFSLERVLYFNYFSFVPLIAFNSFKSLRQPRSASSRLTDSPSPCLSSLVSIKNPSNEIHYLWFIYTWSGVGWLNHRDAPQRQEIEIFDCLLRNSDMFVPRLDYLVSTTTNLARRKRGALLQAHSRCFRHG